jgi:hypothetical protein
MHKGLRINSWTAEENERLKAMVARGDTPTRAAAAFRRTMLSVRIQARKLGTPFPTIRAFRRKWKDAGTGIKVGHSKGAPSSETGQTVFHEEARRQHRMMPPDTQGLCTEHSRRLASDPEWQLEVLDGDASHTTLLVSGTGPTKR